MNMFLLNIEYIIYIKQKLKIWPSKLYLRWIKIFNLISNYIRKNKQFKNIIKHMT